MNTRVSFSVFFLLLYWAPLKGITEEIGSPYLQTYSFQEIGDLSPGARISHDHSGMIWVSHQGTLLCFDNQNWIDMIDPSDTTRNINHMEVAPDGTIYYGAPGDWGKLILTERGKFRLESFRDSNAPEWCQNNRVDFIVFTENAISFTGQNGTIYHDKKTRKNHYFALQNTRAVFAIGNSIYLSSYLDGVFKINAETNRLEPLKIPELKGVYFETVTQWSPEEVLAATSDNQFIFFNGEEFHEWQTALPVHNVFQNIELLKMEDHRIAYSHQNEGLFILNEDGSIFRSYTDPEFRTISDVEMMEPGVIWYSSSMGITKLMYDYPVSVFDHRSNVSFIWPKLISRNQKTYLINLGSLYEFDQTQPGHASDIKKWDPGMPFYAGTADSTEKGFLIGNSRGLVEISEDGKVTPVLSNISVDLVAKIDADQHRYLAFAGNQIIALEWKNEQWNEFAPRVDGVGFPSVTHMTKPNSFWIELGVNRVAHVLVETNRILTEIINDWDQDSQPSWITIGGIADKTVLIKSETEFRFYDETKKQFVDDPKLTALLVNAPFPPQRPNQTENGTIWLGHANGIFLAHKNGDTYEFDTDSLRLLRFNYPILKVLNGSVWVTGEQIMYRIDGSIDSSRLRSTQLQLLSIIDSNHQKCLFHSTRDLHPTHFSLPYHSNSLSFNFFPGSYAMLRSPKFQYRLNGYYDDWSPASQGPVIELANLHEGNYTLQVRMVMDGMVFGEIASCSFSITPPFFRTWYAYLIYGLLGCLVILLIVRWYSSRIQKRALSLEKLVEKGTRELKMANQHLMAARDKAESASQEKSLFLANMSHEIRTPLNGSLGMCKLLEYTTMTKEQADMLQTMRTSNEHLLIIINDILDFSKIEAGEIQLEEVNFNLFQILDEVMDLTAGTLHPKPIELTYSIADNVSKEWIGDPYRIRQILLNLVSNSIKFTEEGSIHIQVEMTPDGGELLQFSVQDTGIGVSNEKQQQLFKPFSQADESTTRHYGGTGLGLSISQKLTHFMGGEIWVTSQPGKGSCFSFTLDLKKIEATKIDLETSSLPLCWPYHRCLICAKSAPLSIQIHQYMEYYQTAHSFCRKLHELENQLTKMGKETPPVLFIIDEMAVVDADNLSDLKKRIEAFSAKIRPNDKIIVLRSAEQFTAQDFFRFRHISSIQKPLRLYQLLKEIGIIRLDPQNEPEQNPTDVAKINPLPSSIPKPKILLVEDNMVNQKVAVLMLKKLHFDCDVAKNGKEAIEKFKQTHHDIILMDIQMPGMDGIEATKQIMQQCDDGFTPKVFAMSAGVMPEQRILCKSVGMTGFIPKPVSLEFLEEKLKPHLDCVFERERMEKHRTETDR